LARDQSAEDPVKRAAVGIAVAAVLPLVGCTGSSDDGETENDPVITLNEESDSWPTALVAGRLSEHKGCLLIADNVAVFPRGTDWDAPDVVFSDGTRVAVGSQVTMGGGYFDAEAVTQDDLPIVPVAQVQACARRNAVTGFVWARP
jgi:hypothetical protein